MVRSSNGGLISELYPRGDKEHHGISAKNFPLYLKELEFRYNHRDELIFEHIAQFLSDQVPDPERFPIGSDSQREFWNPSF